MVDFRAEILEVEGKQPTQKRKGLFRRRRAATSAPQRAETRVPQKTTKKPTALQKLHTRREKPQPAPEDQVEMDQNAPIYGSGALDRMYGGPHAAAETGSPKIDQASSQRRRKAFIKAGKRARRRQS